MKTPSENPLAIARDSLLTPSGLDEGRLTRVLGSLMGSRIVRLSKPLYEALPYLYIAAGIGAAAGSYHTARHPWSDILLVLGVFCVLGGLVVLLKRRDYRAKRGEYRGTPLDENSLR